MVNKVLGTLFGVKEVKFRSDDFLVDRLSRRYSVGLFVLFAVITTTGAYVGDRIECWCPAQFTGAHRDYANMVCWIQSTYYVALEEDLLHGNPPRTLMINYYQWVPLILLLQAMLCYAPSVIWRTVCRRTGLNLSSLVDASLSGQRATYLDIREKSNRYIVYQMDHYLQTRCQPKQRTCWGKIKFSAAKYCCLMTGTLYGNFLVTSYMFVKLLYIMNAVGQLYLLDLFLGYNYHFYGIEVLTQLVTGRDLSNSVRFPRVTMCDFNIRHMNVLHRYKLQCVLPINLFNEKVFIIVWFWLAIVAACSIWDFLTSLWKYLPWSMQILWVKHHLKPHNAEIKYHRATFKRFTQEYLRRDGLFVLRLLSANTGNLAAGEVLCGLWEQFGPEQRFAGAADSVLAATRPSAPSDPEKGTIRLPGREKPHRLHRVDSV